MHERHREQQRLIDEPLQPSLVREGRVPQSQLVESPRLAVDETGNAELLREPIELAARRGALHEVDEMRLHPTFREETKGFARVGAFLHAKDLDFHDGARLTRWRLDFVPRGGCPAVTRRPCFQNSFAGAPSSRTAPNTG